MELRAERGRAVLVGAPELFEPPTALAGALDEWAEVAHAVRADGAVDPATAELVSARGRQLAARLATAAGTTVGYADPVLGTTEHVPPNPTLPGSPDPVDATSSPSAQDTHGPSSSHRGTHDPSAPHDGANAYDSSDSHSGAHGSSGTHGGAYGVSGSSADNGSAGAYGRPANVPDQGRRPSGWAAAWADAPPGPTPWATGLVVSAFAAVVVLAAVVTLVRGLAEVTWLLGAMGLVVVTGGLAPSIWLARHTPLWRWVGLGVAAGIAISWIAVILATLGPGAG